MEFRISSRVLQMLEEKHGVSMEEVRECEARREPMSPTKRSLSIEHAIPSTAIEEKAVDDALGLQMISIRLPKAMIEDLKFLADREGLGYQPLIRRVMKLYIQGEFKAIGRNEHTVLGDSRQVKLETPKPTPAKTSSRAATNAPTPRKRTAG